MPTVSPFSSGDTIRFQVTFSLSSINTDPTTVIFRTKNPNGVVTSYVYLTDNELIKSDTGIFYIDLALNLTGEHFYRWEGTGDAPGISEGRVRVDRSTVLM